MSGEGTPRTEDEIVAGTLTVSLGGVKKSVRILSIREARVWKLALVNAVGQDVAGMRLDGAGDIAPLLDTATDKMLELVVGYDVDGSLGGREWLETKATDAELYAVFRRFLEISFPFVRDIRSALVELRAIGLADLLSRAGSPPESSGNGHSPAGVSDSTTALLTSS